MKNFHRWLFIPAVLILVMAFLLMTGRINIETGLPLHTISLIAAAVAGLVVTVTLGIEAQSMVKGWELPEPEEPPVSDKVVYPKPLHDVVEAMEEAENHSKKASDRVRIEIDIEDARDD